MFSASTMYIYKYQLYIIYMYYLCEQQNYTCVYIFILWLIGPSYENTPQQTEWIVYAWQETSTHTHTQQTHTHIHIRTQTTPSQHKLPSTLYMNKRPMLCLWYCFNYTLQKAVAKQLCTDKCKIDWKGMQTLQRINSEKCSVI